jgi:FimV-like protein
MTPSAGHAPNTETSLQTHSESFRTESVEQRAADSSIAGPSTNQQPIVYASAPGDTLGAIAKRFRPDKSINLAQMMIIIQKINPEAFIRGNINGLKSNMTLRIPSQDEVNQISPAEAITEVKQHNKLWQNRSQGNRSTVTKTALAAAKDPVDHVAVKNKREQAESTVNAQKLEEKIPEINHDSVETITEEDENASVNSINNGRLDIVSEQHTSTDFGVYTITTKKHMENLERSADLAKELAESRRLETEDVKNRIQRLETVISQQKRLITLQTEQLNALNERVRMMVQDNKTPERVHWLWFSIWALTAALGLLVFFFTYKRSSKK